MQKRDAKHSQRPARRMVSLFIKLRLIFEVNKQPIRVGTAITAATGKLYMNPHVNDED